MKKSTGFLLGFLSAVGVISYMVSEVIKDDSFSEETKDNYNLFIKEAKKVGTDIKRTYTAIGDKDEFINSTNSFKNNAKKLVKNTGILLKNGASNVYDYYKDKYSEISKNDEVIEEPIRKIKNKPKNTSKKTSKKTKK